MNYKKILEKKIKEYSTESLKPIEVLLKYTGNNTKLDEWAIHYLISAYTKLVEMKSLVDLYRVYDSKDKVAKKLQGNLEKVVKLGGKTIKQGLLNCINK